jgi:hypothetical protein
MITIISKIELGDNNTLILTDIGYTTDDILVDEINKGYDTTLGAFVAENRTKLESGEIIIDNFFVGVEYVNEARVQVDTIDGLNLTEINNINQL